MKIQTTSSRIPKPLQWLLVIVCLVVGSVGVTLLFSGGEVGSVVMAGVVVTALALLPAIVVGAFGECFCGVGRCLGYLWGSVRPNQAGRGQRRAAFPIRESW